jgi:putative ABC transport system ATP-binding protein
MSGKGIRIEGLSKRYGDGDTAVFALKDVNMQVAPGEVVGLIGPSGSGKSTLLKCLGAVIDPTAGRMTLGDEVIYDDGWKVRDLRALRRDKIGFVFQAPYLIPFLDVTDNVALLPMLAGVANGSRARRHWNCSRRSMCNTGLAPCPRNSPVASSNGSPSRADWSIARR